MRKTKIICTLGPSTDKDGVLRELVANGMNVARFNFSHGSYEEHKGRLDMLKAVRAELNKPVAALLDTKGPEIRLKEFKNGVEMLEAGQTFTLTTREVEGTKEICSITYKDLPQDVHEGGTIMLDDGLIKLAIKSVTDTDIVCCCWAAAASAKARPPSSWSSVGTGSSPMTPWTSKRCRPRRWSVRRRK